MRYIILLFTIVVLILIGYSLIEPLFIVANTEETGAPLTGVTQEVTSGIDLSCDPSFIFAPNIDSNPSGYAPISESSIGDLYCTVITNNSAGFSATISNKDWSDTDVSLRHSTDLNYKFVNYQTTPTYNWNEPGSGVAYVGFALGASASSEDAADIATAFKNNNTNCNTGSNTNDSSSMNGAKCWKGLEDTSIITFASSTNETDSDGETFLLRFRARANSKTLKAGNYVTDLTVTATY